MLGSLWVSVADSGPTLGQPWVNVSCLLLFDDLRSPHHWLCNTGQRLATWAIIGRLATILTGMFHVTWYMLVQYCANVYYIGLRLLQRICCGWSHWLKPYCGVPITNHWLPTTPCTWLQYTDANPPLSCLLELLGSSPDLVFKFYRNKMFRYH